jgi:hypothetical protein
VLDFNTVFRDAVLRYFHRNFFRPELGKRECALGLSILSLPAIIRELNRIADLTPVSVVGFAELRRIAVSLLLSFEFTL